MINEPYSVMTATAAIKRWEDRKHHEKMMALSPQGKLELITQLIFDHPELFPNDKIYELLKAKINDLP